MALSIVVAPAALPGMITSGILPSTPGAASFKRWLGSARETRAEPSQAYSRASRLLRRDQPSQLLSARHSSRIQPLGFPAGPNPLLAVAGRRDTCHSWGAERRESRLARPS